jgi:hypothetical protein
MNVRSVMAMMSLTTRLIRHHASFAVSHRPLANVYQREDRSLVDPWRRHSTRRRR